MPGKARPSLIHKTLENVERCNLSNTDKKCIQEVFRRHEDRWISVEDRMPKEFVSVLGYMTDAGDFPAVRECYAVGNVFYFPALKDQHPVSHWMPMPQGPKEVSK